MARTSGLAFSYSIKPSVDMDASPEESLRNQQQLAGSLAAFQVAMRLRGLSQPVDVLDAQFQLAAGDPTEHVAGAPFQFVAGGGVVRQSRPGNKQRAFLRQLDQVEWRHGAAGAAEKHQVSAWTQDVQIFLE